MIKIMIVDDEFVIRQGIITSIEWESMGMTIVGEAANGKEAYEKALSLEPHIIVTDVKMPIMDGLELTRLVREAMPKVRIIIISGYDEFQYAREALRMGVSEYLLKPIGADELVKLMLKQCNEIIKECKETDRETKIKSIFNENFYFMQERFVNNLVRGENSDWELILEKSRELNLDLCGKDYQAVIIDIDDYLLITEQMSSARKKAIKNNVKTIADRIIYPSTGSLFFLSENGYLFSIINVKDSNRYDLNNLYREIQYEVRKSHGITVTMGLSSIHKHICGIPQAFSEAVQTISNKAFKGKNQIISINDVNRAQASAPVIYPASEEKEIMDCIRTLDSEKLNSVLDRMYVKLAGSEADYKDIKNICLRLITIAEIQLEELGVDYGNQNKKQLDRYVEIEKYETVEDIKEWNKGIFHTIINAIQSSKNDKFKGIVKVAMQYSHEHYYEDIGVEHIAAITYVTPNYFSRVFKKEMGRSYTEWLNTVRLDKSKVLLKDLKLKVYEVAEEVGYNDYKIFTHNFKKYVGCTPKEYRESIIKST
ncbi:HTH-type transcriptional regulator YesS [Ruminiclostridium hungatei]|uniref:Stage 0 sporulation protein A homolog n=1 Tax=Ruminiclostridium hungatei TaxID=48256 RepID=A0A1V4SRA3_RUMHU|nr:response regulator [Ruminiclostridium hungatei]OPX45975.1 HTH-type transcriptional regulator YesS [Ruminiclostridium hungatei]